MDQSDINPENLPIPLEGVLPVMPEQQALQHIVEPLDAVEQGRFRRALTAGKIALEGAVVALELSPVNEITRFGAFAAAHAATNNPLLSGAVLGASTFLIEGAAALSTADLLGTKKGAKATGWVNEKFRKIAPERTRISPLVEAGIGYLGGSAVVLLAKQAEDPSRTVEQNRKHGIFTAAWLGSLLMAQGTLLSNGIKTPNPENVALAALGTAGVVATANKLKSRRTRKQNQK